MVQIRVKGQWVNPEWCSVYNGEHVAYVYGGKKGIARPGGWRLHPDWVNSPELKRRLWNQLTDAEQEAALMRQMKLVEAA